MEIQNYRFVRKIQIEMDEIPDEFRNISVPWLIVQPIVENCFNYGLNSKRNGGIIKVGITKSDEFLHIITDDNGDIDGEKIDGIRKLLDSDSEGLTDSGLLNIHRRLKAKYGPESGLYVFRSPLGGLRVEIKLCLG